VAVQEERIRTVREGRAGGGPVVFWMSRDQRVRDNWALLYARDLAVELRVPFAVLFCLVSEFLGATIRQYGFLLRGLEELEHRLGRLGIPFILLSGEPKRQIPVLLKRLDASVLVMDFDPLRIKLGWQKEVAERVSIPVREVDAHNIVPCWLVSSKQEYGAYTLRPKLRKLLPEFLRPFPRLRRHPFAMQRQQPPVRWSSVFKDLAVDRTVPEVVWVTPGEDAAARALRHFVKRKLIGFAADRNDPLKQGQSDLSPYLHFGQLSAQRVAMEVLKADAPERAKEVFLEELVTRRELSDNFCLHSPDYDAVSCFPNWAKRTLAKHRKDRREFLYSLADFEAGKTHDALWNAAQLEMVRSAKMHGYLRMYWAKKILEWARSPEEAMRIAIYLNDRYSLDGRDPNGYVGIAWSIGGVHDRPWGERKIFGMVRYMSEKGCRAKFDVDGYIRKVRKLVGGERPSQA
jgi:deoxyribodipyrimidine photo-lyase